MYEYLDRRYALALYQIGEKNGKIEEYITDLEEIVNLIKTNEELSKVIHHPQITTSRKKKIFTEIFQDKVDESLLNFLLILIQKDRIEYLEEKLNEIKKIHLEKQNIIKVISKTVIPLTENERTDLIEKLETKYKKKVLLEEQIDKSLIGGVYIRVGDEVIDGTIKAKFDEIKKRVINK
ncbi:ATP synthase subunit delta, sodium ion specific [Clostridium homopropionicum DSM 5847]|uniref:ATP synthase subunit delta n=1 Tax=Clostridium homopropionicum DSM 5847 TaxID=1121318 RepID=A0A0L6Z5W7_9CLOT|nr:F0F1 ATP synthase subunit delta [Clostridium homopropionicum]KOA18356.1 ATP synthase subunit delta, sodium ion specific [Clostridium homopropionicum DSM 5847]SFF68532.1 ATP synthase F1 subcomplex delta subunit [Clostridium homopropionicum]